MALSITARNATARPRAATRAAARIARWNTVVTALSIRASAATAARVRPRTIAPRVVRSAGAVRRDGRRLRASVSTRGAQTYPLAHVGCRRMLADDDRPD